MSKSRPRIDKNQLSIFELLQNYDAKRHEGDSSAGAGRVIDPLRQAIRTAIKNSPLSRHQIAGEMSHLLNESITKEQIDSWTRESDELNGRPSRHVPAEYLPALCKVVQDNEPLMVMGRVAGVFVLPGPEALRAEIQRLDEEINRAKTRKRQRLLFLKEMER
jgi:hypothetical protein